MPLNVPLVDTFAPSRDAFGQLQNALASGPAFQMNKLKLGAAQDERAELRELQQLMAQTPQEKRPEVAIQYLESKGHLEEASKLRDLQVRLKEMEQNSGPLQIGSQIPGTNVMPHRGGGMRPGLIDKVKSPEELDAEARRKKLAELSVTPQTHKPGDVIDYPDPATGRSAFRETIPDRAIKPDQSRSPHEDWMAAFEAEKGRKPTATEMDARERSMRTATTQLRIDNPPPKDTSQRDFRNESAMRQEFTKLPEVKQFQTIDAQMSRAQKAMEEAAKPGAKMLAVDQTLITVLNKMLDPSSVVRESEYARTPNDQAFLDRIKGKIEKIQSGGAGLTPEERKALTVMINNFYQIAKGQYDEQVKFYGDMAGRYGYSPENVVRLGGKASGFAAQAGGGGQKGPKPGAVEQGYRFKGGDPSKKENWEKI